MQNPKQSRWQPVASLAQAAPPSVASAPWITSSVPQMPMPTAIHPSFPSERLPPSNQPAHLSQQQIELIKQVAQLRQQANSLEAQAQQQRSSNENTLKQSLDNLKAHWDSLQISRQTALEDGIRSALLERVRELANRLGLRIEEFEQRVQAVIDTCTKEAIQNAKSWVIGQVNAASSQSITALRETCTFVCSYLEYRASGFTQPDSTLGTPLGFQQRLHIAYLLNDLLHHCSRKSTDPSVDSTQASVGALTELQSALESVAPRLIYAVRKTEPTVGEELRSKVDKTMRDMSALSRLIQEQQAVAYEEIVARASQQMQSAYASLERQHSEYETHLRKQEQNTEQQLETSRAQLRASEEELRASQARAPDPSSGGGGVGVGGPPPGLMGSVQTPGMSGQNPNPGTMPPPPWAPMPPPFMQNPAASAPVPFSMPPPPFQMPPPQMMTGGPPPMMGPPPQLGMMQGAQMGPPPLGSQGQMQMAVPPFAPPPGMMPPPFAPGMMPPGPPQPLLPMPGGSLPMGGMLGDVSGSGALVAQQQQQQLSKFNDEDLIPNAPYYDLPAGLMVPLVDLSQYEYRPLDPKKIRLPPPTPPSDRLLAAVEAFYSGASHDTPRDADGWERLGLFEFNKAKERATKKKEEQRSKRTSRSSSGSRSRGSSASSSKSSRRSSSKSPARSKSRSPDSRRSHSRSSKSKSRSPSPARRRRSRSKSPERSSAAISSQSERRSPSPPGFVPFTIQSPSQPLAGENRGRQMLERMGWSGLGLGAKEQGEVEPVGVGDVRVDRADHFRGLGTPSQAHDPFEQYRKKLSDSFMKMITDRDKERAATKDSSKE